jgi:hypothetical protein
MRLTGLWTPVHSDCARDMWNSWHAGSLHERSTCNITGALCHVTHAGQGNLYCVHDLVLHAVRVLLKKFPYPTTASPNFSANYIAPKMSGFRVCTSFLLICILGQMGRFQAMESVEEATSVPALVRSGVSSNIISHEHRPSATKLISDTSGEKKGQPVGGRMETALGQDFLKGRSGCSCSYNIG